MKTKNSIKKLNFNHETKRNALAKFTILLSVLLIYLTFLVFKYGIKDGLSATMLTWSFFVLCTPIADAGFLIDFPIRIITKIRMIYSEIFVWILALGINFCSIFLNSGAYDKTGLLKIFKHILENPNPFWLIIFISGLGTYLSIYFGDELIDEIKHKHRKKFIKHKWKHRIIMGGFILLIALIIITYTHLLEHLGIEI